MEKKERTLFFAGPFWQVSVPLSPLLALIFLAG